MIVQYLDTICAMLDQGQTATLTAPTGKIFNLPLFASFGNPTGDPGSFAQGNCHAENSYGVVFESLANKNSATLTASAELFGDPCPDQAKKLYVQFGYGDPV